MLIVRIEKKRNTFLSVDICNLFRLVTVLAICLFIYSKQASAQSPFPPPNRLQVYSAQELSFGSFYTGSSGGSVTISPQGVRDVSGTVIGLSSFSFSPAVFDVRLIQGRIVHISFPVSASLNRVGGGESMTITNFTSDKQNDSFVTTASHPFVNAVRVGATLMVGAENQNPAGDYVGSFSVTFIQE